jgi:hypothetical protein
MRAFLIIEACVYRHSFNYSFALDLNRFASIDASTGASGLEAFSVQYFIQITCRAIWLIPQAARSSRDTVDGSDHRQSSTVTLYSSIEHYFGN